MEQTKGEWGFKAHKMQVKLHYRLGNTDAVIDAYKRMLEYVRYAVHFFLLLFFFATSHTHVYVG